MRRRARCRRAMRQAVAVAPILLVVVAVAAQADAGAVGRGRELHVVLHRPDAARGVGPGELDLGHVPVVHRSCPRGRRSPDATIAARPSTTMPASGTSMWASSVNTSAHSSQFFVVHVPEVAGLARLDGLVVEQGVERIGGHGVLHRAALVGDRGSSTVASRREKWMSRRTRPARREQDVTVGRQRGSEPDRVADEPAEHRADRRAADHRGHVERRDPAAELVGELDLERGPDRREPEAVPDAEHDEGGHADAELVVATVSDAARSRRSRARRVVARLRWMRSSARMSSGRPDDRADAVQRGERRRRPSLRRRRGRRCRGRGSMIDAPKTRAEEARPRRTVWRSGRVTDVLKAARYCAIHAGRCGSCAIARGRSTARIAEVEHEGRCVEREHAPTDCSR